MGAVRNHIKDLWSKEMKEIKKFYHLNISLSRIRIDGKYQRKGRGREGGRKRKRGGIRKEYGGGGR